MAPTNHYHFSMINWTKGKRVIHNRNCDKSFHLRYDTMGSSIQNLWGLLVSRNIVVNVTNVFQLSNCFPVELKVEVFWKTFFLLVSEIFEVGCFQKISKKIVYLGNEGENCGNHYAFEIYLQIKLFTWEIETVDYC